MFIHLLCSLSSFRKESSDNFILKVLEDELRGYPKEIQELEGMDKLKFIYDHFRQSIFKLAYLYLKDKYLAEDVLSEVMIKLASNINNIRLHHPKEFASYLRLLTRSASIDVLRKRSREYSVEDLSDQRSQEDQYPIFDRAEAILARLPEKDREILRLLCLEDKTTRQASIILGIKEETARKRYQRAKKRLLKSYKEAQDEEALS